MSPLDSDTNMDVKATKKEREADTNKSKVALSTSTPTVCPIRQVFGELLACPHHRDVLLQLSTIIQVIKSLFRFKYE